MWIECFFGSFVHLSAIVVAELLLTMPSIARRKNFPLQLVIAVVVCIAMCALRAWLYVRAPQYERVISVIWYFVSALLAAATIFAGYSIPMNSLLWVALASCAAERVVFVVVFEIIFTLAVQTEVSFWLQILAFAAVCVPVYFVFYKVFRSDIKYLGSMYKENPHKGNILLIFMFAGYLVSILLLREGRTYGGDSTWLIAVADVIISLFVLITQTVALSTARNGFQKSVWVELFKENKKQYEAFRNTVDYINIKCHDLKHEIEYLRGGGTPDPEKLKELAKNVAIYEAFAKTGNETLDILLTEKNLLCLSESITLTYMADAAGLEVMAGSDIYSLFGNLLDNAIEYLRTVKDGGERFIRLFIKPQGGRLIIHEENYYIGKGTFKGGIPQTTKPDKIRHGFGIRSMTRIAKQYGGDLLISTEEGLFKVDIYIKLGR